MCSPWDSQIPDKKEKKSLICIYNVIIYGLFTNYEQTSTSAVDPCHLKIKGQPVGLGV